MKLLTTVSLFACALSVPTPIDLVSRWIPDAITANDIVDKAPCRPVTFIFARGTGDVGNMGVGIGPKLAVELEALLPGRIAVQGVNYPAWGLGNLLFGNSGGPEMAAHATQALTQCPKTKILLGGFSQGGMVVHVAASKLGPGKVAAAVTFGDPLHADLVPNISNFRTYCAQGDIICGSQPFVLTAHGSYPNNAAEAAQFLVGGL
ncbi:hypothetical protein ASPCAL14489 [Aspergillus calidoustus]|uniref:cutinase n=1 Tax=Aspergillus calidoustus TaxID=454130 RepID=A0A0U5GH79_ASPCI|nr:hypothetical protein ASPCAL14489 [Aspergillus calidoustus]